MNKFRKLNETYPKMFECLIHEYGYSNEEASLTSSKILHQEIKENDCRDKRKETMKHMKIMKMQ